MLIEGPKAKLASFYIEALEAKAQARDIYTRYQSTKFHSAWAEYVMAHNHWLALVEKLEKLEDDFYNGRAG